VVIDEAQAIKNPGAKQTRTVNEEDSGKLVRLREIAEEIAARQEKALVFTQFRETTAPLATFLGDVFGCPARASAIRKRCAHPLSVRSCGGTLPPDVEGAARPPLRSLEPISCETSETQNAVKSFISVN
jgi:hypothetical protein